ncbi:aminotransferase class V-fold PLP-dependent enzyme [Roseovarius sp. MBR-51]
MAGAGPVSDAVLKTTSTYLKIEQSVGAYDTELDHSADLDERIYNLLARLLQCEREDVAIFDNATRAWIEVVSRVPLAAAKRVLTTEYEYAGNLQYLLALAEKHGLELVTIPCDATGDIDLRWLRENMSEDVGLISVVQIPSCCGIVNPVEEIGEVVRDFPAAFIVDACQAVGQVDINVSAIGCDALTGAGRKFLCGPRGTGFAYVSSELRQKMTAGFVDLHLSDIKHDGRVEKDLSTARFLETAERNCGAILGLATAVEELLGCDARRTDGLDMIRRELSALEGITAIDPGRNRGGIFSFRHETMKAADVVAQLRENGVAGWKIKGSHTPLYMLPNGHVEAVRLSSNKITLDEAARALKVLIPLLSDSTVSAE